MFVCNTIKFDEIMVTLCNAFFMVLLWNSIQIKKLKDAIAKHGNERCSLGEAKGLEEAELKDLASIGEITIDSPSLYSMEEKLKGFSDVWNMTASNN